jgi:Icc-related predicted phosphoesterase
VSSGTTLRIAAISDIHYGKASAGSMSQLFTLIAETADVLLICGDLTDYGLV